MRFQEILDDHEVTHCYIRKGGNFYKSNYCGYTERTTRAGVYEKNEAITYVEPHKELVVYPINNIKHNTSIREEIEDLKSRLIVVNKSK